MEKSYLTVIIPFVNEKYELQETLDNIREYSEFPVDIILINDASDDGYDYKHVAELYAAVYIEHKERIGVAASRDEGVSLCATDYFLLLDAHMRFYDNRWEGRIVLELEADPKAFLCCQTRALSRENGFLAEDLFRVTSYGACINLRDPLRLFEPRWIIDLQDSQLGETVEIPCVLGAAYACSKSYWQQLKGLEGLKQYGNDEAYMSMKVWMSGGSCKLLKDIIVGHVYRSVHPYKRNTVSGLYNQMFLCELFLSKYMLKKSFSVLRLCYEKKMLSQMHCMLHENRECIAQLKRFYAKTLIRDLHFFKDLNDRYLSKIELVDDKNDILRKVVKDILEAIPYEFGLLSGQMGIVIFLYHYSRFSNDMHYRKIADQMLSQIICGISMDISYCLASGLCGIAWGIEYLYQHDFIDLDTDKTLRYIDRKVMEVNPNRMDNIDKNYGLGGIVLYVLARLRTIYKQNMDNPFDEAYLQGLYGKLKEIVSQEEILSDSTDLFLAFIRSYEEREEIDEPSIYDVWHLCNPKNIPILDLEVGLRGRAGVGLYLILEKEESYR